MLASSNSGDLEGDAVSWRDLVICPGDYVRFTPNGHLCQVLTSLQAMKDIRGDDVLAYRVLTSRDGRPQYLFVDGLAVEKLLFSNDVSLCLDTATRQNEAIEQSRRLAHKEEKKRLRAIEDAKSPAQKVGEANRRIWATFYPDPPKQQPTKGGGTQPDANIDNDDWRPNFLREKPKEVDEEIPHTSTVNIADSMFVCATIKPDIRCFDELSDERAEEPWFLADDEKREPTKVTDALLVAWHRKSAA